MRNIKLLLSALVIVILALSLSACNEEKDGKDLKTGLKPTEIKNEAFKDLFPLQYASYMKGMEMGDTKYAGSEPRSKFSNDKEPLLPILFNGYGFALDYNEDRGHTYAMVDIQRTLRITDKSPGGCLSCKSTAVPQLIDEMGADYWKAGSFKSEVMPKAEAMGHSAIGCSDCHNPVNMDLRVTRPMFIDAMKERGVDLAHATKNEMRSYVCAQCHSEYFFKAETSVVTFPWKKGVKAEDMYKFYEDEKGKGFKQDYISNISGTPILKAQHPDYETYSEGTHAKAGVSCSDCHMQYERTDNRKKISSHQWTSPLKTMNTSCGTCHSSRDLKDLENQVLDIQKTYKEGLDHAELLSTDAHYYINKMITSGVDTSKIAEAQEQVRLGQWLWDFCAAENSTGSHNPQGSMDNLMKSSNASNKAIQIATEELVKKGVSISELKAEIEKAKSAVISEQDTTKKKGFAVNSYFPGQQPVAK